MNSETENASAEGAVSRIRSLWPKEITIPCWTDGERHHQIADFLKIMV